MVNYQQGKIYKICSLQTDKIYIGSTTKETLAMRMAKHRSDFKIWKNGKKNYVTSYDLLDKYEDCEIILIENFPCNNKDELTKRERFYIDQFKNICVNKIIPGRTKKEYREINRDKIKECKKEYREINKDKIKEYNNEYREINKDEIKDKKKEKIICECESIVCKSNKAKHTKSKKHQDFIKTKS